jgi:hypothetical protein
MSALYWLKSHNPLYKDVEITVLLKSHNPLCKDVEINPHVSDGQPDEAILPFHVLYYDICAGKHPL